MRSTGMRVVAGQGLPAGYGALLFACARSAASRHCGPSPARGVYRRLSGQERGAWVRRNAGYPFRPAEIPLGARIVAVADVFTAITEDRPYRKGMAWEAALTALYRLVRDGALDGDVAALLCDGSDEFIAICRLSQDGQAVG